MRGEVHAGGSSWPTELAWLRDSLLAGPSTGVALERLADPSRAVTALCEAELLGLVCEVTPGRWKVIVE